MWFGIPLGFTTPWMLLALVVLPVLWIVLRAIPPAPITRKFPGVALLLGLQDDDAVSDRTPWWLLVMRSLLIAAAIVGLAGPILNPNTNDDVEGDLLIVVDGSWAAAPNWPEQIDMVEAELEQARRDGRAVALVNLSAPEPVRFQDARLWVSGLAGLMPQAWQPKAGDIQDLISGLPDSTFQTLWMSDDLAYEGREPLLHALQDHGTVRVVQPDQSALAIASVAFDNGVVQVTVRRALHDNATHAPAQGTVVEAHGLDPSGAKSVLARVPATFVAGSDWAAVDLVVPAELRARITHFEIATQPSAAAIHLIDDRLRRREVALISGREDREGLQLLSPLHYLRQALQPNADVIEGGLADVLPANPDVIVLADVAGLSDAQTVEVLHWVEQGGLLLRFAGPQLAASGFNRASEDPLMPVRLRSGGRSIGGAMSWGAPKELAPFDAESPFFGLTIPNDVRVRAQVVAQPDPALASRVIAALTDGTPLVTRKTQGNGHIVLFHVTANAEWSGLPLSGLFVQMLDRLAVLSSADRAEPNDLEGTTWQPVQVLNGFGEQKDGKTLSGVAGPALMSEALGPKLRPGLYRDGTRLLARNVVRPEEVLKRVTWPSDVQVQGVQVTPVRDLSGVFLALALVLMAVDVVASLLVSGRLWGPRVAMILLALMTLPQMTEAQDSRAIQDTREVVLGHVLTGDRALDDVAHAGLKGLSETLFFRTSVEPAEPAGVDLERDEIAFYPLLYWPITHDQPIPSQEAYAKLNAYLRSGGMILFDTRDADIANFGTASANGRKLQRLAAPLDIPPLAPMPKDHVITRTFYLLQDFPGRYLAHDIWVEAPPQDAERIDGMPFRNLNDGVTPVVIGGNDWASAWAIDGRGNPMFPIGRGRAGDRQRELALRFGVNLVMHVLTGNYKSDQVHVPALLDRLGQ